MWRLLPGEGSPNSVRSRAPPPHTHTRDAGPTTTRLRGPCPLHARGWRLKRLSSSLRKLLCLLLSTPGRPPTIPRPSVTAAHQPFLPPQPPPFLTTPLACPRCCPIPLGFGGASAAGFAAHELAAAADFSPPLATLAQPASTTPAGGAAAARRSAHTPPPPVRQPPNLPLNPAAMEDPHPQISNPQTLRPPASTAARACRCPAVGRPAHQPPELEKMAGDGGVLFIWICYFSLSSPLASIILITSFFPYMGGSPSKTKWRALSV
jgi:hypothetical protein